MRGPRHAVFLASLVGCAAPPPRPGPTVAIAASAEPSAERQVPRAEVQTHVMCPATATRVDGAAICPDAASAQGLTLIDLDDAWTPSLFAIQPDGTAPTFRAAYLALAREEAPDGAPLPAVEGLSELYGVLPSLAIARARLADEARHACHAAIDSTPIALLDRPYAQDHQDVVKVADYRRVALERRLVAAHLLGGWPSLGALPPAAATFARWAQLDGVHRGIVAAQRHLVCEGLMAAKDADGTMSWRTANAVELFQRRNFLMPNERLDPETRAAMAQDSRELDYRLALRILRERVVDATGLIEDGTASGGPRPILGRLLDPAPMRAARGGEAPLKDGAPDLIGAATEAAATALGWTGPAELAAYFARHPRGGKVALALPPPPAYHAAHMDLAATIDRGDVWYDDVPTPRMIRHRPTLVLTVDDHGTRRPLIRWPTTIGGWAEVRGAGGVVQKWKESDVGPRVWRNLYAAPTWLPPSTTPDRDLVRYNYNRTWSLKTDLMGPGPHTAYGMTLLVHDQVTTGKDGGPRYADNGIGTHGSASVTSIVNGTSHGCHRLYNQLAVRLADFLLHHREHVVKGETPEYYRRVVRFMGTYVAKINTRGFLYQFTPPVPVEVTAGNILSARKVPPRDSAPARAD
jgi:lipoprotein-anchoring transpeptidase ErfK/SrfK